MNHEYLAPDEWSTDPPDWAIDPTNQSEQTDQTEQTEPAPTAAVLFTAQAATHSYGIRVFQHIVDQEYSKAKLVDMGYEENYAGRIVKTARTFCGPFRKKKLQARMIELALKNRLPQGALISIATHFHKLIDHDRLDKEQILFELIRDADGPPLHISTTAKDTIVQLNRETERLIREEAEAAGEEPDLPKSRVARSPEPDAQGRVRKTWEGDEKRANELDAAIEPAARDLMRKNPSLDYNEAVAMVEENRILHPWAYEGSDAEAAGDLPTEKRPLIPMVIITEEAEKDILAGKATKDIFAMTDGSTITQTEIIERGLSDKRYYHTVKPDGTPVDVEQTHPDKLDPILEGAERERALQKTRRPVPGKLDEGRDKRSFTKKQRLVVHAMTPTCAWPGCTVGAIFSDGHHIEAWKQGGATDIDNLTVLCKFHNGKNDDDRSRPKNGHVFMKDWEMLYQPPDPNKEPVLSMGRMANMTSGAIAKGKFGTKPENPAPPRTVVDLPPLPEELTKLPKPQEPKGSPGPPPF